MCNLLISFVIPPLHPVHQHTLPRNPKIDCTHTVQIWTWFPMKLIVDLLPSIKHGLKIRDPSVTVEFLAFELLFAGMSCLCREFRKGHDWAFYSTACSYAQGKSDFVCVEFLTEFLYLNSLCIVNFTVEEISKTRSMDKSFSNAGQGTARSEFCFWRWSCIYK